MTDTDLTSLEPGMAIVWGGTRVTHVPEDLAESFGEGDSLIVRQDTGELIHIPSEAAAVSNEAVGRAHDAFGKMGAVEDEQISKFYNAFADALSNDATFALISAANDMDVAMARQIGKSVTRLVLDETMRKGMIEGLRGWSTAPSGRGRVLNTVNHDGWRVDQIADGLGVVGFVFEGRPNVFADATGVLRGGNTVVFRIGSDALGTALAIVTHALDPALASAGLPEGAAVLIPSASRAAGLAMMGDTRLALAVARGSGAATERLGAVARQAGNAVSLHGTGGAWIVAGESADAEDFAAAVYNSLDRKVCNTLNTVCIPANRADELVPAFLGALERAGERRGTTSKLHVLESTTGAVPVEWFDREVPICRAGGPVPEQQAESIAQGDLGVEWEWEDSPEVTLAIVDSVSQAVGWFNQYSPRFVASIISDDPEELDGFFAAIDAPFIGNGFTRWVDGQYALDKPELGLSNWQNGRLFGRGGILSGDSAFTVRSRVTQDNPDLGR